MRAAYQREMDVLESHLPFLASVGSVSPYIGLFGTVWGIMNAFRGLSNVQQATLPRWRRYCRSTRRHRDRPVCGDSGRDRLQPVCHDIDRLAIRFESFMEEFLNILQRQTR
jgi:biopolymer transport protein TolQ